MNSSQNTTNTTSGNDVSTEELNNYAKYIGIDPENDADLMNIAKEGVKVF